MLGAKLGLNFGGMLELIGPKFSVGCTKLVVELLIALAGGGPLLRAMTVLDL